MLLRLARTMVVALAGALTLVACSSPRPPAAAACGSGCTTVGAAVAQLSATARQLVTRPGGPPGLIVLVDRGGRVAVHSFGTSEVGRSTPIAADDHLRLASVSKAYSGATALSLVAAGRLHLTDTVGRWVPGMPAAWNGVTLAQLLQHTSGIPDFSQTPAFGAAVQGSLLDPPPPAQLLSYAFPEPMTLTPPGSGYHYSNSDNELVALMVEATTGTTYEQQLAQRVLVPLGLGATSLPSGADLPAPYAHGYDTTGGGAPEDVTNLFAAGWSWASGGVVATPSDADRFIRGYARGATTSTAVHAAQFRFRPGSSEPAGPGTNDAGLGIFRYTTSCGTVYGHTGNTAGYTQFAAATADGSRSVVVSVNAQITPKAAPQAFDQLRSVEGDAVCAALTH